MTLNEILIAYLLFVLSGAVTMMLIIYFPAIKIIAQLEPNHPILHPLGYGAGAVIIKAENTKDQQGILSANLFSIGSGASCSFRKSKKNELPSPNSLETLRFVLCRTRTCFNIK